MGSMFTGAKADEPFDIAIVGGGIIGVITALGLIHRGIRVKVYERAAKWPDIGAAIGFTGVARECMEKLDPKILETLGRIAHRSPAETVRYWDGFHPRTKQEAEKAESSMLFEVPEKELAFWACLRTQFLLELAEQLSLAGDVVQFNKQLVGYANGLNGDSEKVMLRFADGTTAQADAVIACDGVHSATRRLLLGENPAAKASYSHKLAYRTFASLPGAVAALGAEKAMVQTFHVKNGAAYNIHLFVHDPENWTDVHSSEKPSTRHEVQQALEGWGPHITELLALLPEQINKWAIFDMADNPAPTYAFGRVCITGDAAHASSPFHGAGAGMGVEDALVLAELLARVGEIHTEDRKLLLPAALQAYSNVRIERSQWLVQSSREIGEMYEWRSPLTGKDSAKIRAEFDERARKIWNHDVDAMLEKARSEFDKLAAEL